MKKIIITFIIGFIVGSSGYWALRDGPLATKLQQQPTFAKAVDMVQDKVLERAANEVKDEMKRDGKVVMTKPTIQTVHIEDDLLNDLVKAKLAADPSLAKSSIKSSSKEGQVELRGNALSYEQVTRAMRLAFECDAASKVTSTIEVP
jgi:osmotically-inducible protein OsmY